MVTFYFDWGSGTSTFTFWTTLSYFVIIQSLHVTMALLKPLTCFFCKRFFDSLETIRRHVMSHRIKYARIHRRLHSDLTKVRNKFERRHQCEYCQKCFTEKSNLTKHIQYGFTLKRNHISVNIVRNVSQRRVPWQITHGLFTLWRNYITIGVNIARNVLDIRVR